ncbi:cyclase family protein [Candidatus Woesearchaeota archaeon]|nr:cyclase family protein [Candidatus Woesearchaeota archaeon]
MRVIDISRTIAADMVVYKDKPEKMPQMVQTKSFAEHGANETVINIDSHTGTHADAFFHMLEKGKTIEQIPADRFIGPCQVLDFTKVKDKITEKDLGKFKVARNEIILLKTKKKIEGTFNFSFTYLDKTAAAYLAKKGVKLVGIDELGIERDQEKHDTHVILFKKGIPIVEGLDLTKVKQGKYLFIGLPVKIKQGDGAPVRAVLVDGKL